MTIELIFDRDCPNAEKVRANLRAALAGPALEAHWTEWDRGDRGSPAYARNYGSPTVLVNGKDVAEVHTTEPLEPACFAACRLYAGGDGSFSGAPSVDQIAVALRKYGSRARPWRNSAAAAPGILASLLPKLACPACWPAYAGLLGSLGLGFLIEQQYLLPLTAMFLAAAVGALGLRARTRCGYAPFALGLIAAGVIFVGKFGMDSNPATYAGVAGLVIASAWNAWPRRRMAAGLACGFSAAPAIPAKSTKET